MKEPSRDNHHDRRPDESQSSVKKRDRDTEGNYSTESSRKKEVNNMTGAQKIEPEHPSEDETMFIRLLLDTALVGGLIGRGNSLISDHVYIYI